MTPSTFCEANLFDSPSAGFANLLVAHGRLLVGVDGTFPTPRIENTKKNTTCIDTIIWWPPILQYHGKLPRERQEKSDYSQGIDASHPRRVFPIKESKRLVVAASLSA